jgi:hypothetical protein
VVEQESFAYQMDDLCCYLGWLSSLPFTLFCPRVRLLGIVSALASISPQLTPQLLYFAPRFL